MSGLRLLDDGASATGFADFDIDISSTFTRPPATKKAAKSEGFLGRFDLSRGASKTEPFIAEGERGASDTRNRVAEPSPKVEVLDRKLARGQATTNRSTQARGMRRTSEQLQRTIGHPGMAVYIQALKRQLAAAHASFDRDPAEANFISIVTMIEAALVARTWREYSPTFVNTIYEVLKVAYEKPDISYNDCAAVRRAFEAANVSTVPSVDLEQLTGEDLREDENGLDDGSEG